MSTPMVDAGERAEAIYESRLKAVLEPAHDGEVLVIDPDTGEYCVGPKEIETLHEFQHRFPGVSPVLLRVGRKALYRYGTLP
ncbi:MAG: hypothetical protein HY719_03895 [Planctomycetes bacterium]|nr:hypothetical protein [Planctomycetota bacterium]